MTLPRSAFVLVLAACAGCARPDAPLTAAGVAGCYVLEWHHGDTVYADVGFPDSVRLESGSTGGLPGRMEVSFAGLSVPSDTLGPGDDMPWYRRYHASHWRMGSGDSIHVVFNENWTRYETALRVRGGRVEGTAAFRSDDEPAVPPVVSVRGERFPCPTKP
jgi:hypothetical protein